jgi:transposase
MADNVEILNTAISLLIRAVLLAARFSGRVRRRSLARLATVDTDANAREILFLKDRVYQLEMQLSILQKQLTKKGKKPRYEVRERLLILWHIEAFQIPRRKVSRYFGIARSTLYRWLHKIEDQKPTDAPANKTPTEIASLVWEITKANLSWGRIRIANQLKLLGIFLSASTVRNILQRPKPPNAPTTAATAEKPKEKPESRSIPAWYPNHVWSVDATEVRCWGLWPIHVLLAIDHFSRKVVCVAPLEGPQRRLDHRGPGAGPTETWGAQTPHLRPGPGLRRRCLCPTPGAMEHQTSFRRCREARFHRCHRAGDQDAQV